MYYLFYFSVFIFFIFILYVLQKKYSKYLKFRNKLKMLNKEEQAWLKSKKFIKIYNNNFEKTEIIEDSHNLNYFYLSLFNFNNLKLFANYKQFKITFNKEKYIFFIPIKTFYD